MEPNATDKTNLQLACVFSDKNLKIDKEESIQHFYICYRLPHLTLSRGGHISSMEARIFMKYETYVHKIIIDQQLNFHKDLCKDARARDENARTCDALQRFRSESTKIKKMRFFCHFCIDTKKVILFTFANQAKIL